MLIDDGLGDPGASATLPSPTSPLSVSISITAQPWKRKLCIASPRSHNASMALVQKCGLGGTVSPFHSNTRARTRVIFMA